MLADVESAQHTVHSNRLIAFLDVLGFSSRLDRDGLARVYAEYAPLVDHVQYDMVVQEQSIPQGNRYSASDPRGNVRNFELARFIFDSLVLVSLPTDDVSNICKSRLPL